MDFSSTNIFALAEKRLSWLGQRQGVLAQNIANANTPGYVARDIKPFSDLLATEAQQSTGDGSGFQEASLTSPLFPIASEQSLDGNAVVLDEQLEKIAETDTDHALATNLYKKYVSLFQTAIGRN